MLSKINFLEKLNQILLNENLVEKEKERLERVIKHSDLLPEDISANILIEKLDLETIKGVTDEDGYYREFVNTIDNEDQESQTEIFYMLKSKQVSCLHALNTFETWHWLGGEDVLIFIFNKNNVSEIRLNADMPKYTIPANTIFGAKLFSNDSENLSWITCKCIPGFVPELYKNPSPEDLECLFETYPHYKQVIKELTPENSKNNSIKRSLIHFFTCCFSCIGIKKIEEHEQTPLINPPRNN